MSKNRKKPVRYFDTNNEDGDDGEQPQTDSKKNEGENTASKKRAKKRRPDQESLRDKKDPFPGPAPISDETVKKYRRGEKATAQEMRNFRHRTTMKRGEDRFALAAKQAARSELLLPEETGFLEADEGEETYDVTQEEIRKAVDIASATKNFELRLDQFGPYRMDFTRNGRHLLLGGRRGHLAGIDWVTKKLHFETNVTEEIQDVQWLHLETMCAVAQKKWMYIYDNNGVELHCIKKMHNITRMEFLPYHFLLAGCSSYGGLQYLDVSVGKLVCDMPTKSGRLDVMTQNQKNAIIHLGHPNGTVTMWSPNSREPLVKMLCHKGAVRSIAIDKQGTYMATGGMDRQLKIFDLRTYKPLQAYQVSFGAGELCFSQKGLLAAACNNVVEVYKDCCLRTHDAPYMMHELRYPITNMGFCPYEDVLGVSHFHGYTSLLIPGAGEANFDALEANPYQNKQQRREYEIKALLEKIQPEMITLNPSQISAIDKATMEQRLAERKEMFGVVPPPKFEPRHKLKGRSKSGRREKRKQGVREEENRSKIQEASSAVEKAAKTQDRPQFKSALDRFKN
ncbi:WD repeat-containing protein 46-like [Lytechinus variegatus]|uniref:WD repeat-containing protein 46-like n=1 Tax=Lytechinus variegatus TaxID=7654 RepID=UPI001BB2B302|nr:WD repeat-containing protein 46-like [Lytechinus variegatus]